MMIPVFLTGQRGSRDEAFLAQRCSELEPGRQGRTTQFQDCMSQLLKRGFATPIVVTGEGNRFIVAGQLQEIGAVAEIIVEPESRNSLPAAVAAALVASRRSSDAHIAVLSPNPDLLDAAALANSLDQVSQAGMCGEIAVLDAGSDRRISACGCGEPHDAYAMALGADSALANRVPNLSLNQVQQLTDQESILVSGILCSSARNLVAKAERLDGESVAAVRDAVENADGGLDFLRLGKRFKRARQSSFEATFINDQKRPTVVPITSTQPEESSGCALSKMAVSDPATQAEPAGSNVLVMGDGHRASDLWCQSNLGLAVSLGRSAPNPAPLPQRDGSAKIATPGDMSREVDEAERPAEGRVHRPWGWYQTVDLGTRFRVKRIAVTSGRQLSLQKHFHRAEHWVVVSGTAEVTVGEDVRLLSENESVYIPIGCVHRLRNPGRVPVELVEVQTGSYLEEDDIVRLEDDFGRA